MNNKKWKENKKIKLKCTENDEIIRKIKIIKRKYEKSLKNEEKIRKTKKKMKRK